MKIDKNKINYKKYFNIVIILILVISIILLFMEIRKLKKFTVTDLEKIMLQRYIDNDIDTGLLVDSLATEELDGFTNREKVNYVISFLMKNTLKNEFTKDEIVNNIRNVFGRKIANDTELLENNLMLRYDEVSNRYKVSREISNEKINSVSINLVDNINKKNENEYEIDLVIVSVDDKSKIVDYLISNGIDLEDVDIENNLKDYINLNNYKQLSENIQNIELSLKVENDNLIIDNIKNK